jgi:hypothetical protein
MCQKNHPKANFQLEKKRSRTCVICNAKLIGRSDKVFCDIKCKNKYHSEVRKSTKTLASETQKILMKNYIILAGVMNEKNDNFIVKKQVLDSLGFNFDFVTRVEGRGGKIAFFIYEYRFEYSKTDLVIVSRDFQSHPVSPFLFKRWKHIMPYKSYLKSQINEMMNYVQPA